MPTESLTDYQGSSNCSSRDVSTQLAQYCIGKAGWYSTWFGIDLFVGCFVGEELIKYWAVKKIVRRTKRHLALSNSLMRPVNLIMRVQWLYSI